VRTPFPFSPNAHLRRGKNRIKKTRHADLLQFIAQKESKCLELRSQLAIHESELLELKRKWERIVHCEFGRNASPKSPMHVPSTALANTSGAVVLNGLVEGVRALAAVTTSPPLTPSVCRARGSSSTFAKRVTRQTTSNSISSTTTTTSSAPSAGSDSPRLSQSSMSSVAEEKPVLDKAEEPGEEPVTSPAPVAQEKGSPVSSDQSPSRSNKILRRRSYNSRVPLVDALKPLTGDSSRSSSGNRASVSVSAASPTFSVSIAAVSPLGAMGLGRANLGETAQGWVDTVGSKLVELQRGQT